MKPPAMAAAAPKFTSPEGAATCPQCGSTLRKHAVLCVECGYDLRSGTRLETRREEGPSEWEPAGGASGMSPFEMVVSLFSFGGRITRGRWWTINVGWHLVGAALGSVLKVGKVPDLAIALPAFVLLWVWLATDVKRWHDVGKSGVWWFIRLIPCVGPIWAVIELGFWPGNPGPNEYGDEP